MKSAAYLLAAGVGMLLAGLGFAALSVTRASAQPTVPAGCRSVSLNPGAKDVTVLWAFGPNTRMGATFKNQGPGSASVTYYGTSLTSAMTMSSGREETMVFTAANVRLNNTSKQATTVLVCNPF